MRLGAFIALVGALSASALSAQAPDEIELAEEIAAIERFQTIDQKLQDIGWRLVTANAAYCADAVPAIGLQLQDAAGYRSPETARAALGIDGDFAVQTAARGSPAAMTGAFRRNREITRIAGSNPNAWSAEARLDWRRLVRAHDSIRQHLVSNPDITFEFADGSAVDIRPVTACASRFELTGDGDTALADGERVVIGTRFGGLAYPKDQLAGAIAHELAHNLLQHKAWLDRHGRSRRNVRATEREADRLMPWLLANAGYNPEAAVRFFERFRPSSGAVLFLRGSHEKWSKRAEHVRGEFAGIAAVRDSAGKSDWSQHFERETASIRGVNSSD
ncbi:hypothetical protein [Erythrobacter ani]|uniref:Peptidase M48 domain-containing protein n=1 Tax=Erythrobacter ani TaxID=2827235 RepID=A0ABS6SKG0_9SPHN|nr:hypothetical protein [Erythrobacter ani]MBV7265511.1 hypothetical protein [Erythrobacter ani]